MRKVYWLSVTFLILVKKWRGQTKTGIRQDETEERYLSVTYTPNGEC